MDLNKIKLFLKRCGGEVFLIFCGAVLTLFPDSAVALVTKIIAWVLVVSGLVTILGALKGKPDVKAWIIPALGVLLGGYMLANPLMISNAIGRVMGLFLVIQGAGDLSKGRSRILPGITLAAGVILFLIPRALVNTLLGIAGLVLIVIGAINLIDKLCRRRYLDEGSDPNIIDADV